MIGSLGNMLKRKGAGEQEKDSLELGMDPKDHPSKIFNTASYFN